MRNWREYVRNILIGVLFVGAVNAVFTFANLFADVSARQFFDWFGRLFFAALGVFATWFLIRVIRRDLDKKKNKLVNDEWQALLNEKRRDSQRSEYAKLGRSQEAADEAFDAQLRIEEANREYRARHKGLR